MATPTTIAAPAAPTEPIEFSISGPSTRFAFHAFEVPEHLEGVGGEQISAMHQFPGGRRVIQTFGPVPHTMLSWSGIFLGENTFGRASALDRMRRAGQELVLTYGPFKWTGILKTVKPKPGHEGYIPYDASFEPNADISETPEPQATSLILPVEASVQQQEAALVQGAATYTALGTNNTILAACAGIVTATDALDTLLASNSGLYANIPPAQLAASTAALAALALQLFTLAASNASVVQDVTDVYVTSFDAVSAYQMAVLLQQMVNQLGTVQTATPTGIQITLSNPCLFVLAAQYYGDPDKWQVISNANGGLPPFNSGVLTLVIPLG